MRLVKSKMGLLKKSLGVTLILASASASAGLTPKQELGKLLYFDTNLSMNRNQACASCHLPSAFFIDPANSANPAEAPVSLGSDVSLNGGRNAPTAAYAAFSPVFHFDPVEGLFVGGQFWDGRAATLAEQAKGPFLNPVEMAMPNKQAVLNRVAEDYNPNNKMYKKLWKEVYDVKLTDLEGNANKVLQPGTKEAIVVDSFYNMLAEAIGEFEKSSLFSPFSSKFDYMLLGLASFTAQEQSGMDIFNGKAMCNACHTSDNLVAPDGRLLPPMFTDFTYDNIGLPKNDNPLIAANPADLGLGGRPDIAALDPSGSRDGKFKVSTLRNIEKTAPYGHNGVFSTLEQIVHFYNTRDVDPSWPAPEVNVNVNHDELGDLKLTPEEEADLVAFLKTLTDGYGDPLPQFQYAPLP